MALFMMQHCKGDTIAMCALNMQSWKSVVFWMFPMQTRTWKRKIAENLGAFTTGTMHFKATKTQKALNKTATTTLLGFICFCEL